MFIKYPESEMGSKCEWEEEMNNKWSMNEVWMMNVDDMSVWVVKNLALCEEVRKALKKLEEIANQYQLEGKTYANRQIRCEIDVSVKDE